MIRAIVLEDEWYNLEEICTLVERTGFMQVAGRFLSPLQALEQAALLSPQVAFIDIEMGEMDGLTCAAELKKLVPGIQVAFVTAWSRYAVQAFDIGATDYIMKPIKQERFERLVEKIRKEFGVSDETLPAVILQSEKQELPQPMLLTQREQQVLVLLSRGLTNREIAGELFVSISGVKKHLEHIYRKLGASNKVNAITIAREKSLLS